MLLLLMMMIMIRMMMIMIISLSLSLSLLCPLSALSFLLFAYLSISHSLTSSISPILSLPHALYLSHSTSHSQHLSPSLSLSLSLLLSISFPLFSFHNLAISPLSLTHSRLLSPTPSFSLILLIFLFLFLSICPSLSDSLSPPAPHSLSSVLQSYNLFHSHPLIHV